MKRTAPLSADEMRLDGAQDALSERQLVLQIASGDRAQRMQACALLASVHAGGIRAASVRAVLRSTLGADLFLAAEGAAMLRAWAAGNDDHGTAGRVMFEQDAHAVLGQAVLAPAARVAQAWLRSPGLDALGGVFAICETGADASRAAAALQSLLVSASLCLATIVEDVPGSGAAVWAAVGAFLPPLLAAPEALLPAGVHVHTLRLLLALADAGAVRPADAHLAAALAALASGGTNSLEAMHAALLARQAQSLLGGPPAADALLAAAAASLGILQQYATSGDSAAESMSDDSSHTDAGSAETVDAALDLARDAFGIAADAIADDALDDDAVADVHDAAGASLRALAALLAHPRLDVHRGLALEAADHVCAAMANAVLSEAGVDRAGDFLLAVAAAEALLSAPLSGAQRAAALASCCRVANSVYRRSCGTAEFCTDAALCMRLAALFAAAHAQGCALAEAAALALPAVASCRDAGVLGHAGVSAALGALVAARSDLDALLCLAEAVEEMLPALSSVPALRSLLAGHSAALVAASRARTDDTHASEKGAYIRRVLQAL